jgi:aminoglycoside phosphotransferase (APT) family kinase protein
VIDLTALASWMDAHGLGFGPILNVTPLAGGSQNVIVRFTRANRDYVLRRPPAHPRPESNETMRREARVLGALAGTQVPHPRLIAACADEAVLGAAFYLMEPVEGFNPQNGLPASHHAAATQRRMGEALVEGLALLHALDPAAVGLGEFGKPEGFLERQVARWGSQLEGYGKFDQWPGPAALGDVGAVAAWLEAQRPAGFVPGVLHGDFHLANVMFNPGDAELAAIIDWELATIGDPLVDLGWLLATWPQDADGSMLGIAPWNGFPAARDLAAHYAAHASRSLDALDWYAVFGCYKLAILLEGTHARACAGKAPVDVGDRLHGRAVWLMARARRWIAGGVFG